MAEERHRVLLSVHLLHLPMATGLLPLLAVANAAAVTLGGPIPEPLLSAPVDAYSEQECWVVSALASYVPEPGSV